MMHIFWWKTIVYAMTPEEQKDRIIVPTARQSVSLGQNGNVDQFFLPRESFTFRDRREVGRVVWQSRAFVWPSEARLDSGAKSDSPTDRRSRKGKLSQGKESGLSVRFLPLGYTLSSTVGCIFCLIWCLFNHKSKNSPPLRIGTHLQRNRLPFSNMPFYQLPKYRRAHRGQGQEFRGFCPL